MKKVAVLTSLLAAAVFAVFSFATVAVAFPPLPDDLNIVQPDPSLPKELAAFSGKWEGKAGSREFFLIVEKIDQEKATLRLSNGPGWETMQAKVIKEYGKWKIWFNGRYGKNELSIRGKYLDLYAPPGTVTNTRVP
jgi:hypothetical protein